MKKILIQTIILVFGLFSLSLSPWKTMEYQNDKQPPKDSSKINLDVQEIGFIPWNHEAGLLYKQVPGANLGVTAFQILDLNHISFLSDSRNEIVILNKESGTSTRFPVVFGARDFIFENNLFYVFEGRQLVIYDKTGQIKGNFPTPSESGGTVKIARFDNSTFLLLPTGNSLKIESGGMPVKTVEHEGWITNSGNYILTRLNDNNTYYVKVITPNGNIFEQVFTADKKIAGVFVVGCTTNQLILDVQTFNSENPVSIERSVLSITITESGMGNMTSKKLPDCYYVLSNKDLDVTSNGIIFNMVTSPQGTHLFSLTEKQSNDINNYPAYLMDIKYHFNDHLIRVD